MSICWDRTKRVFSSDPTEAFSNRGFSPRFDDLEIHGKISAGYFSAYADVLSKFHPGSNGSFEKKIGTCMGKMKTELRWWINKTHRLELWTNEDGYAFCFGPLEADDGTSFICSEFGSPFVMTKDFAFLDSHGSANVGVREVKQMSLEKLKKFSVEKANSFIFDR